ncbi:MAG: hypothetical protein P9M08_06425 [Candidatus Erginobacter occultus]|nr:hypothetical protein [Candidatus Erginobacter occultus]
MAEERPDQRSFKAEKPFGANSGLEPPDKPIDDADDSVGINASDLSEETLCPSCGRFVGAYEKCPYCGAALKKRMSLLIWKRIAVGGTILGLLVMWFAATQMTPELVQIGEIQETYNNAQVTIRGTVVDRRLDPNRGSISLTIADDSGAIGARSFSALPEFKKLGNIPRVGDKIETVGTIQIDAVYGTSLNLDLPHRLKIQETPEPTETDISRLREADVYNRVTVTGMVKHPVRFGKAVITDKVNDLVVALDPRNIGEEIPDLNTGDGVEITGVIISGVEGYTIIPAGPDDIRPYDVTVTIPKMAIKDLTMANLGDLVEVEGTVQTFTAFKSGGGSATISDGTGRIIVGPLFASIFDNIPDNHKLKARGTRIRVKGTVAQFRGELQVGPGSAENVTIITPEKQQ